MYKQNVEIIQSHYHPFTNFYDCFSFSVINMKVVRSFSFVGNSKSVCGGTGNNERYVTFLISSLFSCLLVHLLFSFCLLIIKCAMFMMRNLVSREISDSRNENRLYYLMNRQLSKQTYKCFSPTNATLQAFCNSVVISMEMIQTSTLVFFHQFIFFLLEHVFPRSRFAFISPLFDI